MRFVGARHFIAPGIVTAGLAAMTGTAQAVPDFASQTGQPCTACHVGAFGPQLTPFGRAFKISGYTQQGGDGTAAAIPLSAMVLTSFNNTKSAWPDGSQPTDFGRNNNFAIDQISIFAAGRITDWAGAFVQGTYSGLLKSFYLDQVDVRPFTKAFDLPNTKELRVGVTLNNNPTVTDPYNTALAWGYPYVTSGLVPTPTPAGTPLLANTLSNRSIGITAYAWYDRSFYLEAGAYSSMSPWVMGRLGERFGPGATQNLAPYVRAAYEWNWNGQSAHVGASFLHASFNPATDTFTADGTYGRDNYTDYAVDGGYQFYGDGTHIVSIYGLFIHEDRSLNGTVGSYLAKLAPGTPAFAAGPGSKIDHLRIEASYWYQNTYGFTLGYQGTWGTPAPVLFTTINPDNTPGNPVGNSVNGKPNTDAFLMEANWVPFGKQDSWAAPFANLKLGIQYIAYTRFNGGSKNYDGNGRNASDNNTLYVFAWLMF